MIDQIGERQREQLAHFVQRPIGAHGTQAIDQRSVANGFGTGHFHGKPHFIRAAACSSVAPCCRSPPRRIGPPGRMLAGSIRGGREACQPMLGIAVDIIGRLAGAAAHCLWPPSCALCGQTAGRGKILDLCAGCEGDLPLNDSACEHCAEPLPPNHSGLALCGRCLQRPPVFDACVAPFRYAFPVDRMIQGLKYRRELVYGRILGQLLAAASCTT